MNTSSYNHSDLYKAWQQFIENGAVPESNIRPEVARSWHRSRGLDPNNINMYPLPNRVFQAKLADNIHLISCARPVMQQISRTANTDYVLVLADSDGCIMEAIGDSDMQGMQGYRYCEKDIGTNAIGTSLLEGKALEICGMEHYCQQFHSHNSAGVPVHDSEGGIIGVLASVSHRNVPLPENILQVLQLGGIIIENQLRYKAEQSFITKTYHRTCSSIIDAINYGMIVVDANRRVINVNQKCLDAMEIGQRRSLIGRFIQDLIADDNQVLTSIFSQNPNEFIKTFHLRGTKKILPCKLVRRQIVRNSDDSSQVILGFEIGDKDRVDTLLPTIPADHEEKSNFSDLVGESQVWIQIKNLARKAAGVSSNVLITGESGTGKELVAKAVHEESGRKGKFVAINCGAIPKELLQSELFGYEEGSFTGARKGGGIGKLEMADKGTLFLDEIGEMPFDMQVNLLRFIQDRTITRIGGYNPVTVDVRIIAATNRDLKKEMLEGTFRDDLYYRLSVINIELPPLRKRRLDIPLITRSLIDSFCVQFNRDTLSISDQAMAILCNYSWPGNVRELKNIIENAVVFTNGEIITEGSLPSHIKEYMGISRREPAMDTAQNHVSPLTIEEARDLNMKQRDMAEREQIVKLIDEFNGNISQVAKRMGLSRTTLYRKIKKYEINA